MIVIDRPIGKFENLDWQYNPKSLNGILAVSLIRCNCGRVSFNVLL